MRARANEMSRRTLMTECLDQKAVMHGSVNERHGSRLGETNLSDLHRTSGRCPAEVQKTLGSIIVVAEFSKIGIMVSTSHANPR